MGDIPAPGAPRLSNFSGHDRPTRELYDACIHCGLCLNYCPTYRVLGQEMDSPRGRIYQVLQADEGRMPIGDGFVTHIDRCLDCRACETACPSGVQYGRIVERARAQIEQHYRRPLLQRMARRYFYGRVLRKRKTLARWARLLRFYQRSGLQRVTRASGVLRLTGMSQMEALSPRIEDDFSFDDIGTVTPAIGEMRGRVAFLVGCVASVAFAELNSATIRVLALNGIEVHVPKGQRCCGALHAHAGFRDDARFLAQRNVVAFMKRHGDYDAIITNAAGCGSTLKEYGELLQGNEKYAARATRFATKVKDINEYLVEIGLRPPKNKLSGRVTYQDPCHLAHGQRIRSAPRELLRQAGLELVEMPHADHCCGSAGTYNVSQPELSMEILDKKMEDVASVDVPLVATANVGCMLQLRAGMVRAGLKRQVKHVVELLDEAYGTAPAKRS